MSIASVQSYVQGLLSQMAWPAAMAGVPPLHAVITPPNPNVQSEIPTAYIWPVRGRESRDSTRLRAGAVPRIAVPGGPSGTKPVEHTLTIWLVWMGSADAPQADSFFPGMAWQVQQVLRSAAFGAGGQVTADPQLLTDPWDASQSWLVDLGEVMSYEIYVRTLEAEGFLRYDGVLECSLTEVIAA